MRLSFSIAGMHGAARSSRRLRILGRRKIWRDGVLNAAFFLQLGLVGPRQP